MQLWWSLKSQFYISVALQCNFVVEESFCIGVAKSKSHSCFKHEENEDFRVGEKPAFMLIQNEQYRVRCKPVCTALSKTFKFTSSLLKQWRKRVMQNSKPKPKWNSTSVNAKCLVNVKSVQKVARSIHARQNADLYNAPSYVSKGCHWMAVQQRGILSMPEEQA